jgi:hypothetical protein
MNNARPQSANSRSKTGDILLNSTISGDRIRRVASATLLRRSDGDMKEKYHQGNVLEYKSPYSYGSSSKSEFDDAMLLMEEIARATGQPLISKEFQGLGYTKRDKLVHMRTEPSASVLQKYGWRTFFEELQGKRDDQENQQSIASGRRSHASVRKTKNARSSSPTLKKSYIESFVAPPSVSLASNQSKLLSDLNAIFHSMKNRVELLWNELKIPSADRKFYLSTLCQGPPESMEQCKEIAKYIKVLQSYRNKTISTLFAIEKRESDLSKCFEVLAKIHKSGLRSRRNKGMDKLLKEELVDCLHKIQSSTVQTVQSIIEWRQKLWRPHPFIWNGANYMDKIKTDMSVLESDNFASFISEVSVDKADLLCILFNDEINEAFNESPQIPSSEKASEHNRDEFAREETLVRYRRYTYHFIISANGFLIFF